MGYKPAFKKYIINNLAIILYEKKMPVKHFYSILIQTGCLKETFLFSRLPPWAFPVASFEKNDTLSGQIIC